MIINTINTSGCQPQTIVIGRRGTYDTMQIAFDLSYLVESYGNGVAVLAVKRSQDESAYPAIVTQEDNTLTWTISDTDTYYVGSGECQLMWYVDGGLAKTIIYPMVVMRDILQTAEQPPDGYENWIEHLTELGAETQQNAQNAAQSASDAESAKDDAVAAKEAAEEAAETAQEAVVHAPIIQNGYWYIWNDGEYVDTGVRAEGQKGDKGDTGEKGDTGNGIASITKTGTAGLVDTYTVTYTDGTTTTFTVTNGAKGDKGDTGATGNGIQSITKTGTSGNVDTYTITYTNGQTMTFTVTNGAVTSVAGKTGAVSLDANDVAFSESGTYDDGTVGKELSNQKNAIGELNRQISDVEENQIPDLKSAFDDITETVSEEITEDITYTDSVGFYNKTGKKFTGGSYDNYRYTDILPVNTGDVLSFIFSTAQTNLRVLTAYTDGVAVSDDGKENTSLPYTVPEGINGVRLTYYNGALTGVTKTYIETSYAVKGVPELDSRVDALEAKARSITNGMVYEFNINSDNHELNDTNTLVEDMFGYSIQFDGRVTTFNGLTLGHGNGVPYGGYVKITPTHFEYYLGTEANPRLSEAHNLTIADYISVRIDAKPSIKADFTIYTNGGVYTKANQTWDVRCGRLFVNSVGSNVLTGCRFAYMCRGWAEKVHLYGDSYFGVYNDKWTNYLTANNWNKCNLNAYPGRASAEALRVAKNALNHSKPEIIVWCMGMNDGDDGGAVDTSWKNCVEELMTICDANNITLILATIPNVPTVDNTAKNAYVRTSGYRYIDFASAVGASSGTTWFDNMLSSDGVHPAVQGAIALFNQAIADVPELMQ